MQQITLIAGVMAMLAGALLFGLGAYGWRPAAARASAWLGGPQAVAGALGWLVRFAVGAGPARGGAAVRDITPQARKPATPPAPAQRAPARRVAEGGKGATNGAARRRRPGGARRAGARARAKVS